MEQKPPLPEHEQLLKDWTEDSKIDRTNLLESLYACPILHSRYLTKYQGYKVLQRKKYMKFEKLKGLKTRYYNGELTKEELDANSWKQYLFKRPMKSEMEVLLSADSDLQRIKEEIEYLEILIDSCSSILKEIHSRNFTLKNIIEVIKFEAGA